MPGGIIGGAASGAQAGMAFGPYGAAIGAVLGGVLGALSYKPIEPPKLTQAKLDSVTKGQSDFLEQGQHLGEVGDLIQKANNLSNDRYQQDIEKFAPGLKETTGNIGATGAALAGGNLPQGFLSAGPNGKQLSAADLGLTSDSLKKTGLDVTGAGEGLATKLNPFNATSTGTLISPGALLARRDSANYYNTGLQNQAILGKSAADAINPFASGVATGLGALGSSMRGFGQNAQGITDLGRSGETPGTDQFGDDFYQQFGAEGDAAGMAGDASSMADVGEMAGGF